MSLSKAVSRSAPLLSCIRAQSFAREISPIYETERSADPSIAAASGSLSYYIWTDIALHLESQPFIFGEDMSMGPESMSHGGNSQLAIRMQGGIHPVPRTLRWHFLAIIRYR